MPGRGSLLEHGSATPLHTDQADRQGDRGDYIPQSPCHGPHHSQLAHGKLRFREAQRTAHSRPVKGSHHDNEDRVPIITGSANTDQHYFVLGSMFESLHGFSHFTLVLG